MAYASEQLKEPDIVDAVASLLDSQTRYDWTNMLSAEEITESNFLTTAFEFYDNDANGDGITDEVKTDNRGIDPTTGKPWNTVTDNSVVGITWADAQAELTTIKGTYLNGQYVRDRQKMYKRIDMQLADLYDDIAAGRFGTDPKSGKFYLGVKAVKDAIAKP